MHFHKLPAYVALVALMLACALPASAQSGQGEGTSVQRLNILRSRLDSMRRSLNSGISALNARETGQSKTSADDALGRLRGLEREASSILNDVNDLKSKIDRAERVEASDIEKLETSVNDLDPRVQSALRATAGERTVLATSTSKKQKKKGFLGIFGGGSSDKYEELTGTIAPGRDRVLFEEAAKEARKGNYETARYLFNNVISTYPESLFLPMAKLAVADTFYLEGGSGGLIQAAAEYQNWLTFFPTHPLADDVMLKMAEAEMRQMGLADRDVTRARKAEQRLKVLLQQFPNTNLRPEVEIRLREVQENLGMHNLQIARFYNARHDQGKGGLRGAQSRLREIVDKYPNFSYMDEVLARLGDLYEQEEEPDEAAKYYQRLIRDYPNSDYVEKAKDRLQIIGAAIPDPDPERARVPKPEKASFTQRILTEVTGSADVTVNKNGVIISKSDKGGDLIDVAIRNQGNLPETETPTAPVQRRPPARPPVPSSSPATPDSPGRN